jgi:hypothetical protein
LAPVFVFVKVRETTCVPCPTVETRPKTMTVDGGAALNEVVCVCEPVVELVVVGEV